MKRFSQVVLALALAFSMSVTAFAISGTELDNGYKKILSQFAEVVDGNTLFKSFPIKKDNSMSVQTGKTLGEWLKNPSELLIVLQWLGRSDSVPALKFYYVPDDVTLSKNDTSDSQFNRLEYTFSKPVSCIEVRGSTLNPPTFSPLSSVTTEKKFRLVFCKPNVNVDLDTGIFKLFNVGYFTHSSELVIDPHYLITDYKGELGFRIDDEQLDLSKPEKPTLPSQPEIGFPTYPKVEGEYIAYDTTVWNGFAFSVRDTIGKVTNICLIMFGVITAASIIVNLFKKFTGDSD